MDHTDDNMVTEFPHCLLPELYIAADHFHKEKKKSNLLKSQSISLGEAKKALGPNLRAPVFSEPEAKANRPTVTCTLVRRKKSESMVDLLHRSLLISPSVVDTLNKSHQRLLQKGIPAPTHTFPYEILAEHATMATQEVECKKQVSKTVVKLTPTPTPTKEKPFLDNRILKYLSIDPEKQFMDLKDLEWRYYKGLVKWKRRVAHSFTHIKYDREMRYIDSHLIPDAILPPLVDKFTVIYPQVALP